MVAEIHGLKPCPDALCFAPETFSAVCSRGQGRLRSPTWDNSDMYLYQNKTGPAQSVFEHNDLWTFHKRGSDCQVRHTLAACRPNNSLEPSQVNTFLARV
jgi:hypothetical protein